MDDNMRAELCKQTLVNARKSFGLVDTIVHTDRGSQYTSEKYRDAVRKCDVRQSMNSTCGDAATTHAAKIYEQECGENNGIFSEIIVKRVVSVG